MFYESVAKKLGMTKRQLFAQFKKRHAYCFENEMKVIDDIKANRFVDYANQVTEIIDAYDAEHPETAEFADVL